MQPKASDLCYQACINRDVLGQFDAMSTYFYSSRDPFRVKMPFEAPKAIRENPLVLPIIYGAVPERGFQMRSSSKCHT